MTFWLILILISIVLGGGTGALSRRRWLAVLAGVLLGLLVVPYLSLRYIWDVTHHRDAQDGLAFLFGPLVAVPLTALAAYAVNRWRLRRTR